MKRAGGHLIFAALLAVACAAGQSQTTTQQAQKTTPGMGADRGKLQTPSQVSDQQKKAFIRMLETLPHEGEFYSEAAIDKAGPYLPVLLAFTEKDIGKRDIYPFAAMSRGLCDRKEYRPYAIRHFAEIRHPMLKLLWGAMLFDGSASSPEVVRFLQGALKSERQAKLLSEIVGPEYEDFKDRVLAHADRHAP